MLVALLERAPAELWSRSPALCPPLKVMLLYATSKRVRALMRTLGVFLPAWIVVKGDYEFTTANTAPFLRGLQAVPTFSSLRLLMLRRHVSNSIPSRVITSALLALEHVCTIEALCLDGNKMRTPHAIAVLSGFVARQHKLSSLHLSHTGVGASLRAFCSALARETATEKLFLNSAEVHLKRGARRHRRHRPCRRGRGFPVCLETCACWIFPVTTWRPRWTPSCPCWWA
jgi:hypothetical protein